MSSGNNQTNPSKDDESDGLPVAAIVCIAVAGYVILVVVILIIRHILQNRGSCQSDCCGGEEGTCCTFCVKANEACPCCCSSNVDGCLSKICGKRKRVNCIDILLCNCCGCTEGTCDSSICTKLMPESLCGCCSRETSVTCASSCACCCCDDEMGPNTCSFLCLEVKVRNPRLGSSFRRSKSAPPAEIYGRRFSTHEPPDKLSYDGSGDGKYHPSDLVVANEPVSSKIPSYPVDGGDNVLRKRSSSHSPTFSVSRKKHTRNSQFLDGHTGQVPTHLRSSGKSGARVNFEHSGDRSPQNTTSSTQLSSSLSEESLKNLSGQALLNKSNNNAMSSSDSTCKSSSRARRSLREGQRSQRFPNQVLVSAETLRLSMETSRSVGSNTSSALTSNRRPLPPLRNSVQSLT